MTEDVRKILRSYSKDVIIEWLCNSYFLPLARRDVKEEHKREIEICGGFLKTLSYKEAWRLAWDKASVEERKQLFSLPNWDNDVFKEITGIDAEKELRGEE